MYRPFKYQIKNMSRLLNNARRLLATSTKMNWIVDSIPEESGSIGKAGGGEFAKKMAAEETVYFRKLSAEQVWSKLNFIMFC